MLHQIMPASPSQQVQSEDAMLKTIAIKTLVTLCIGVANLNENFSSAVHAHDAWHPPATVEEMGPVGHAQASFKGRQP